MQQRAFTLFELLLVVAILAIVGLALIRGSASNDVERKLELAAAEVAAALRFARSEAMRTGQVHGARISSSVDRVRVYRLDTSSSPPVEEYSVRHPIDKKLYDLDLGAGPFTSGVKVLTSIFTFGGIPHPSVSFDSTGAPVSPVDLSLMDAGAAVLLYGGRKVGIAVAPMTGRVTVQDL